MSYYASRAKRWAVQKTPEEKAAEKTAKKEAAKALKKTLTAQFKDTAKAATTATEKAHKSGSLDDHKAAGEAHREAARAGQALYSQSRHSGLTGSLLISKRSHHEREAHGHEKHIETTKAQEQEKKNEAFRNDPKAQAKAAGERQLNYAEGTVASARYARERKPYEKTNVHFDAAMKMAKDAHNHAIDAGDEGLKTRSLNMVKSISRQTDHYLQPHKEGAGGEWDESKHPRGPDGKFG